MDQLTRIQREHLEQVLQKLQVPYQFGFLLLKECDVEKFLAISTKEEFCEFVVGSSHPLELKTLFQKETNMAACSLKNLRGQFLLEEDYLEHLAVLLENGLELLPGYLSSDAYTLLLNHFGLERIIEIRKALSTGELFRSLNCLAHVIKASSDKPTIVKQVHRWILRYGYRNFFVYISKRAEKLKHQKIIV